MTREYYEAVGHFLGGWPASFFSLDIESNGMAVADRCVLPVEIGWCHVEDREIVSNDSLVLDWFPELNDDEARDFASRLAYTAESMAVRGNRYPFTPRYLELTGMPPRVVLDALVDRLRHAIGDGLPIVGHNIYGFDCPVLERTIRDWTGTALQIPAVRVIDTMVIARGAAKKKQAFPSGTRREWFEKLGRGPEKCNLMHVATNFAIPIDPDLTHSADYDAMITAEVLMAMAKAAQ